MTHRIRLTLAGGVLICLTASAGSIQLPSGMAGVPNIGAIPCSVFTEMLDIGSKGVRHSLLTWAEGYFFAKTGKTLNEILDDRPVANESYNFDGITERFVEYCAANPEAITSEAVIALGGQLMVAGQ